MADNPEKPEESHTDSPAPSPKPSVKLSPAPSKPGGIPLRLSPKASDSDGSSQGPKPAEKVAPTTRPVSQGNPDIINEIMGAPAQDMQSVEDEWEEEYIEEPEDFDVSMDLDTDDDDDEVGVPPAKPAIKPALASRSKLPKISDLSSRAFAADEDDDAEVSVEGRSRGPEAPAVRKLTPKVPTTGAAPRAAAAERPAIAKTSIADAPGSSSPAPTAFAPRSTKAESGTTSKLALAIQGVSLLALILLIVLLLREILPLIGS